MKAIDSAIIVGFKLFVFIFVIILIQGFFDISGKKSQYSDKIDKYYEDYNPDIKLPSFVELIIKNEKITTSNAHDNSLTEKVLIDNNVLFPHIHILMLFKETSFCSDDMRDSIRPTLCSYNWSHIFDWEFNPHNYGGTKKPKWRKTTCIESIGEYVTRLVYQGYLDGSDEKIQYLMQDPHCIYSSKESFAKDIHLLQEAYFYLAKKKFYNKYKKFDKLSDLNDNEYIQLLKDIGYNPYNSYYYKENSGLYELLDDYYYGSFQEKYEQIYNERMNASFY